MLLNNPVLIGDGRYALAMSFALEEVIPEMMEAFKDMADPEAIKASILWTMTIYAAMWMAPEPVFSKGLATVVTASVICYLGVDTFWTLMVGWRRLVEAAALATSFSELSAAGKKYGKVMGKTRLGRLPCCSLPPSVRLPPVSRPRCPRCPVRLKRQQRARSGWESN
ncbi:hypothetical protein ACN28S_18995 [Cystobacter fuscus]